MTTKKPSETEEEYFARQEVERRKHWAKEKEKKKASEEKTRLRELHHMKCPKCGMDLEHFDFQGIELDRCVVCGGTWFDKGEVEQLIEREQSMLRKFFKSFRES